MSTTSADRTDRQAGDVGLLGEIERWRHAEPEALRLARLVTDEVRRTGRHHLADGLLGALDALHRRYRGRDAFLDAFLDAVLARRRDRFRNQTYLALPLVELVRADLGVDAEHMSALLMADVLRYERRSTQLDDRTRDTRVRHAAHFVAAVRPVLGLNWLPGDRADAVVEQWFGLTALPVSIEHDEYFFIRALQAHEMVFTTLTDELRAATQALRLGYLTTATARVRRAVDVFDRAAMLFRLVATMRPAAFHAFRQYTEGTSAIQSEAYKRFELACGTPSAQRLFSEAFDNVPVVRAEAPGLDNFSRAWQDLRARGPAAAELTRAVEQLEAGHQRWKTTHYSLAAAMLGSAHGSGYTEGVPYLRRCLENRLFDLDAAAPGGEPCCQPGCSRVTCPVH
ncbi:tryptophan 2,3-dioxygenase family protein [Pseudonocardia sp. H11422]|uniref:tryptophan 2,3-dioxygenase family protein n=1 Tax=Pseudonocardia sp. H11422 TaxID=2835866 RepID=UPI001BDC2302|nr:tryptophan 2,3-dioxygenase family protein [Pseudonocardia sp. H11422]